MKQFLKYLTPAVKEVINSKGKVKRTKKAAFSKQVNKAANELNITPTKAEKGIRNAAKSSKATKGKKTFTPDPNYKAPKPKNMGSTKGLTSKQKRERAKLIKKVKGEMAAANLPKSNVDRGRRRKTGPKGTPQEQLVEQGPLLSKVPPPENISKARRRELIKTGQAKMGKRKDKSVLRPTGEFAPPASMIAEEMGLKGKGQLPTAEEAKELGLTIKKYGGKVKRNMGGPVRGVGKAMRGFGNAKYSSKLY